MKTRAALGGIFASAVILVVGWQAGASVIQTQVSATPALLPRSTPSISSTGAAAPARVGPSAAVLSPPATSAPAPSPTAPGPARSGTFIGSSVSTRYGAVQVQITVSSGKISNVTALHLTTDGGRSVEISNRAAPVLRAEVLAAQSAKVSSVSGATYTSDGYLTSLQSALDQAGL